MNVGANTDNVQAPTARSQIAPIFIECTECDGPHSAREICAALWRCMRQPEPLVQEDIATMQLQNTYPQVRDVLLIDADDARRRALASRLRLYEEFRVSEAESPEAALARPSPGHFDAVLCDAELPACDPASLCRDLRRRGMSGVIMILHPKARDSVVERALAAGAIDCLPHETATPVLVARLRAHIRIRDRQDDAPKVIGPLVLQPSHRLLVDDRTQRRVQLTEKEMNILRTLARNPEQVIAREALLDAVWNVSRGVETHTVETHIYRLRQKLSVVAGEAVRIATAPGGYCLISNKIIPHPEQSPSPRPTP